MMSLFDVEYNLKVYGDNIAKESKEEGREEGRQEGREEGRQELLNQLIESGIKIPDEFLKNIK